MSYDEKPLRLLQKLKDAEKNPVFSLKHIRDIESPLAIAERKQADRIKQKENATGAASTLSTASDGGTVTVDKFPDFAPRTVSNTEDGNVEEHENVDPVHWKPTGSGMDSNYRTVHNETAQPCDNVGYAVAIYPYTAEQEDEFDVAV